MGLWKMLTTPLLASGDTLRWKQPLFLGMRLRQEVPWRLALLGACLGMGAAGLALVIVLSGGERVPLVALAVGALFGLVVSLYLAFRKEDWGGNILVGPDDLQFRQTYPAFPLLLGVEQTTWPYGSIRRCMIVPGKGAGSRPPVLLVSSDDGTALLGIADGVELSDLAKRLKGRGVEVVRGDAIPRQFVVPCVAPRLVQGALGLTALVVVTALFLTPRWGGSADMSDRKRADRRDALADGFSGGNPAAEAFGNPPGAFVPAAEFGGPMEAEGPAEAVTGRDGPVVGGAGGFPFRSVSPDAEPLLGVAWFPGEWAGKQAIGRVEPIFDHAREAEFEGIVHAPAGFAVGAMEIDAEEFVFAIRLVFWRLKPGGTLDPGDSLQSEWIGFPSGKTPQTATGNGARVIGLHGRGAAVLDAVGLVVVP